ncbi:MAG: prephenate dehydrogenase/arogenate dehydrogenase family protein, partial [Flavobacteriaceae bacterium]|nr:prephenate dehydrogenase/arogenate dehydrogenase family protein [Flavobacteriaceae bacterium]
MQNIYIIGIGLIGGSMALDIKRLYPDVNIRGIDANPLHVTEAIDLHIIDEGAELNDIANADLVIIAIPVDASLEVITQVLDNIPDSCLVIEAGSTKEAICGMARAHSKRRNLLTAHPIAGTE